MKTFYVSSYGKSDNKGIYIIDLNEENQKLLMKGFYYTIFAINFYS